MKVISLLLPPTAPTDISNVRDELMPKLFNLEEIEPSIKSNIELDLDLDQMEEV